ncbi:prephenate dehydratase [bacterium]|nr:prephenate dehydratase [bacterium]
MSIEKWRSEIDEVDRHIIELLGRRAEAAVSIGKEKQKTGQAFYDAGRQKMILDRLCEKNDTSFPNTGLRHVFAEIMSACLNLESRQTIAFFGAEASFTHMAAKEMFGTSAECIPYKSIDDVFMACEKGWTDYGVVPIENSTGGVVHDTLDRFVDTNLIICSEITLSIHHVLMANCSLEKIQRVYSHPQPFLQCRAWLKQNLPGVELHETDSTSEGAKLATRSNNAAAIGSELAAKLYDLDILVRGIEDMKDNITRFWIIGRSPSAPTGDDKTSIMFSVKDRPGALYDLLKPFHEEKINLTKIESRPTKRRPWEYVFFVDLLGHLDDPTISRVVHDVEEHCEFMKIMGSYPRNDRPH